MSALRFNDAPRETSRGAIKRRLAAEQIHARLINWGRWNRLDDTLIKLGYPRKAAFVFEPPAGGTIDELDAIRLEEVISTFDVAGRRGWGLGELYAFILRVEYAERPEGILPPPDERARFVREKFKRPCAERTYRHHLEYAKLLVQAFV